MFERDLHMTVKQLFDEVYAPALKKEVEQLKEEVNEVRKLRKDLEHILGLNKALKAIYTNHE